MKRARCTTLRDVAEEAGVSVSLVSHVLNNYPSFREETRRRVWAASGKLGYKPNQNARQLQAQCKNGTLRTRNIAMGHRGIRSALCHLQADDQRICPGLRTRPQSDGFFRDRRVRNSGTLNRMAVDYGMLGTLAIKALLDRLSDSGQPCLTISVPCQYLEGETCAVPGPRHETVYSINDKTTLLVNA